LQLQFESLQGIVSQVPAVLKVLFNVKHRYLRKVVSLCDKNNIYLYEINNINKSVNTGSIFLQIVFVKGEFTQVFAQHMVLMFFATAI
jgi:hypothetical protein